VKTVWLIPPFVAPFASGADPEQSLLACPRASARLRIAVAASEWRRRGNQNTYWDPGSTRGVPDWKTAHLCVVPKYYHDIPLRPWLDACLGAKAGGCRLVIDICDNPFAKPPPVPDFYSRALKDCDAVVVNSGRMAELMASRSARQLLVIEDAILAPMGKPAFAPAGRIELLWFGHPTNFPYLDAGIEALARFASAKPCRLTIVTEDGVGGAEWARDVQAHLAPALEARFIPWSLAGLQLALQECDLVLIPSDPEDPLKAGASANRIAEALNAGRFAVASPVPSYLAFADSAWLGRDLVQGIEWALGHREEALARIGRGQALVADKFAADRIGRQWCDLFENLARPSGH
jgi:glycosyltransferase involved in cell wall biosynthesis